MENINLFGKSTDSAKPNKKDKQASVDDVLNITRDVMRRLRQIEERYNSLRKTIQVNEQNMLKQSKKSNTELKAMDSDILEIKKHVRNMGEEIKLIIREMANSVKQEDVKVIEKYMEFWQPLNFVTHNELQKEIRKNIRKEMEDYFREEKAKALKD